MVGTLYQKKKVTQKPLDVNAKVKARIKLVITYKGTE